LFDGLETATPDGIGPYADRKESEIAMALQQRCGWGTIGRREAS